MEINYILRDDTKENRGELERYILKVIYNKLKVSLRNLNIDKQYNVTIQENYVIIDNLKYKLNTEKVFELAKKELLNAYNFNILNDEELELEEAKGEVKSLIFNIIYNFIYEKFNIRLYNITNLTFSLVTYHKFVYLTQAESYLIEHDNGKVTSYFIPENERFFRILDFKNNKVYIIKDILEATKFYKEYIEK